MVFFEVSEPPKRRSQENKGIIKDVLIYNKSCFLDMVSKVSLHLFPATINVSIIYLNERHGSKRQLFMAVQPNLLNIYEQIFVLRRSSVR